ncbi:MAG: succinate dehydrogenase assembly factor 2 [Aliishimia sp.]
MKMRSMRRGIKEMDLILSGFADVELTDMNPAELDTYDALLHENDHDLYLWVTGQEEAPAQFQGLIAQIAVSLEGN